jgi:EAL domain-containing protein (putative c-di-GMP-specific phosphodiesterase class I)
MTLDDEKNILALLNDIRKLGIKISVDDFGTGYSSFSRIVDLPINYIKIDRAFIMNLPSHQKSIKVCIAIINIAHELGLKTIAEGVEKKEQADFLFENKCDFIQGFYFYKPMNTEEIDKLFL